MSDDDKMFTVWFKYRAYVPPPPRTFVLYDVDLCEPDDLPTDPEDRE